MRGTLTFVLTALGSACVVGCSQSGGPSAPTSPGALPPSALVTIVDVGVRIDVTAGGTGTWNWAGQSVTLPAGSRFNNIRFNWYTFQGAPAAFGTLYVLAQEYLGLPGALGPSSPGFLARSENVSGGQYAFTPAVVLEGGRQYWFYTDTQGSFATSFDEDIYAGGDLYVTGHPTAPFRKALASGRMVGNTFIPAPPGVYVDANFKLQGSSAP